MAIILIEPVCVTTAFYPLTLTRPLAALQCGLVTLADWWQLVAKCPVKVWTGDYLQADLQDHLELSDNEPLYFIRSGLLPDDLLWQQFQELKQGEKCVSEQGDLLVLRADCTINISANSTGVLTALYEQFTKPDKLRSSADPDSLVLPTGSFLQLDSPATLVVNHGDWMGLQFALMTADRKSAPLPASNKIQGEDHIFVEEGALVQFAYLNALTGPIYIGRDTVIMEGSMIRGPFGLGERSTVKMGAKIYGATASGPDCTLGGEIKNTLIHRGTNKGHEGYLGDSIVGAWCNFGAGAGNSNVKNTAGDISVYDYNTRENLPVGKKFGLMMGDYSRVAINSSLNTGSSIGVCSNVFGPGLLPKFIPSFSWGTSNKPDRYGFDQALAHIKNWMDFKHRTLSGLEIRILNHIFEHTS